MPTFRLLPASVLLLAVWIRPAAGALISGPMVGLSTTETTAIWLMTDSPAQVQIEYWPASDPEQRTRTASLPATGETGYAVHVDIEGLISGTRYGYRVLLDGRPATDAPGLHFATQPKTPSPPRDFRIATGSCHFLPDPPDADDPTAFGAGFGIFDVIAAQRPDLMLWLGDSIYYRDADLAEDSATRMNARWTATRRFAPMQRLLHTGQHLAIWDDHDYGPNNSDRSFALKDESLALFKRYWANGRYGLPEVPGVFSKASFEDLDLVLLDDRYYRDDDTAPSSPEKTMLGAKQLDWLKRELKGSSATFKLIVNGSRMLSDRISDDRSGGEGWHNFPQERTAFLDWLKAERIDGVFLVSGDIHYTHLTERERPGTYPLIELTCSPLTARVHPRPFPIHELPGTLVTERNFCTLEFSGPPGERVLTVASWSATGARFWSERFPDSTLRSH